jgi:hypothetical protein
MLQASAEYVGALYETSAQRHPQETPLAQIYAVENAGNENGVYAVPVFEDENPQRVFLSQARLITLPPGKREGKPPIYGLDEVVLNPPYGYFDLKEKPKAREAIIKELGK